MEWPYANFSPAEMTCRCGCGKVDMSLEFMGRLQTLRERFGAPMIVTSGYRCPDYNERISGSGRTGPHTTGRAVDIAITGAAAIELLRLALECGFTGIGVAQKGAWQSRFLHLDTIKPRIWSY